MRKHLIAMGLAAGLMVPVSAWAQGPGGQGGPGAAMRTMHGRLSGLVRGLGELEKSKVPLTKDQAKKIVAVIGPWKGKPKMTEDDAKGVYMHIEAVLTTKQKNELDKITALRRRSGGQNGGFGGGGAGAGGRPGGGGGFGGGAPDPKMRAQFQKMAGLRKTMNPFYPPTNYKEMKDAPDRMKEGMTKRYQGTMALVTALSKKAH